MTHPTASTSIDAGSGAASHGSAPAVELYDLTKHFRVRRPLAQVLRNPTARRTVHALHKVTLTVGNGELHALLGQNGAGKSTLFRILATLLTPDSGRASVFGEDVVLDPSEARALVSGAATEERSLNWRLSSVENLRLFAALYRIDRRESEQRVEELLSVVGLSDAAGRMAGQLSSGMRQRLLVARALLPRPRLLLLDEPTRSLDPLTARDLRRFLREELNERMGITILLATHDAEEALSLSDRVSVLHHGRLIAGGRPGELAARLELERLRLVCRAEDATIATRVMARGGVPSAPDPTDEDGWVTLEVRLQGVGVGVGGEGGDESRGWGGSAVGSESGSAVGSGVGSAATEAELLAELREAGVQVARLERVRPGLADLLQRAISLAGSKVTPQPGEGR